MSLRRTSLFIGGLTLSVNLAALVDICAKPGGHRHPAFFIPALLCLAFASLVVWICLTIQRRQRRAQIQSSTTFFVGFGAVGTRLADYGLTPDPDYPNTFGWRCWILSPIDWKLYSPIQQVAWDGSELRAPFWEESDVVRGVAGIHAHIVPEDWAKHVCPEGVMARMAGAAVAGFLIDGIVERFDRYVLGEEGWRAEWVIVRKLLAPTEEIGLELERRYPDVEIVYPSPATPTVAAYMGA